MSSTTTQPRAYGPRRAERAESSGTVQERVYDVGATQAFLTLPGFRPRFQTTLKLEALNAAGSIKLKTAREMLTAAEDEGLLGPGATLIESTSGNLGIALAMISAAEGYRLTLVTDPNTPAQSIRHMRALGAEVVVVRDRDHNGGYLQTRIALIEDRLRITPGLVWLNQYRNPANARAHSRHTMTEILDGFGVPDWLFVGIGSSGTGDTARADGVPGPGPSGPGPSGTGATDGTWVALDGRHRVGVLTGRWAKPAAEYIGEGAREAARRTRIAALRTELSLLLEASADADAQAQALATRRRTLDTELAAVPDDAPLIRAHADAAAAADTVRRARTRRDERAAEVTAAAGRAESAAAELQETAADLGLPPDRPALAAVRRALAELEVVLAGLWPALRERSEASRQAADEREEAVRAGERTAELAVRAEEADREAAAADERLATLRSTVGAAVAELQRLLAGTAEALRGCAADQRRSREQHTEADRWASRAEGRIEQLERAVTEAAAARSEAIAAFQRFTATGLIAVAVPDLAVPAADDGPWAPTPAITLARALETELSAIDDSDGAWERVQRRLSEEFKTLQDALSRHGNTASARMVEDGMIVDIVYQGRERAVPELAEALAVEVGELTRILSAHEPEILETHLITEVAGTLQELTAAAERQVLAMNAELEERPTSTGMRLRLVWRPSRKAPAGLAQARGRLLQTADAWTAEDRAAVGEFLQTQIARQQTEDAAGSRLEHLTAALDYRSWHEFAVERQQHGRWVPATGPASGGERVLAVSVPLFAAASSHYASAGSPYAPRLVTLDEAFAGVDDDSRAKCLGLLHAFDLDVVMTSEREWACYPQVPGIAIAQLARVDEAAAVLVTRWEWDGTARTRREDPVRPADPELLWA